MIEETRRDIKNSAIVWLVFGVVFFLFGLLFLFYNGFDLIAVVVVFAGYGLMYYSSTLFKQLKEIKEVEE